MLEEKLKDIIKLKTEPYVVFDVETTGLYASNSDTIIEIGAVKIENGEVIDTFSSLINPNCKLSDVIIRITGINDDMLKDAESEEDVVRRFVSWIKELPLIAHNASFDVSFLKSACKKYDIDYWNNKIIDTLEISRQLRPYEKSHTLSNVMRMYGIKYDEASCHRADYDANKTGEVFKKMLDVIANK